MSMNAKKIFQEAQEDSQSIDANLRDAAEWFHDNEGEMFERKEACTKLEEELRVDGRTATRVISQLVGDSVDPVVQVNSQSKKFVGVAEFQEFEGAYGYLDYHDIQGQMKKVVCQRCVNNSRKDSEVFCTTSKTENSYAELVQKVHDHYKEQHTQKPERVRTGATLASGTTIAGNISWHAGNDGSNSGLDADKIHGKHAGDIAPIYNDGNRSCYVVNESRFGAEGSSTTNTSYTTIANSDIAFDPSEFRDSDGNLYMRVVYHLKHSVNGGNVYARVYRQNAASAVSGTAVSTYLNDSWDIVDTGWTGFNDSGFESYHLQLKSGDGYSVEYNSAVIYLGIPK